MKAKIISETINPDCFDPRFTHEQEINNLTYSAKVQPGTTGELTLTITATDFVRDTLTFELEPLEVGVVRFLPKEDNKGNQWLESEVTSVKSDYRSMNVASTMYAYAKMLGNDIRPSSEQSQQGAKMWDKWNKSGEAKYLMKESTELIELKKLAGISDSSSTPSLGSNISMTGSEKGRIQRERNIQPGTEEWFKLWFARPYLTGEKPI